MQTTVPWPCALPTANRGAPQAGAQGNLQTGMEEGAYSGNGCRLYQQCVNAVLAIPGHLAAQVSQKLAC
ncbi:hypothetical protein [Rhodanobacter geophilus]|uniref:Uncharacterized protein n=1 Tax=Rhodanobacter geophilus TaxID=3162488 RepID=A0ABV3QTA4_9GAMM